MKKQAINLLDKWVINGKIDNIGSITRFRLAFKTRKVLDLVMVVNSCKQKYSSINVRVQIESIKLDTETTIRKIEPIIIQTDNTLLKLPKIETYQVKLNPISWIFDEFLGTTANDPKVIRGNINVQYRIKYKNGEITTKYVGFSCDDRFKPGIFLYGCHL